MKVLLGALAVLLALCITLGIWARAESKQNDVLNEKVVEVTIERDQALGDLAKAGLSCASTDLNVGQYSSEAEGLDLKAQDINRSLDTSLQDLKLHQATTNETDDKLKDINVGANAVLSDSMWNTYCEVQPTDRDCTTRRIAH